MKITYIYHSSFLIETGSAYFLFDYELGNIPDLLPDRPLYVLASHAHGDHFNPRIFRLRRNHPDVRYILSDDIPAEMIPAELLYKIVSVGPDREYRDSMKDGRILTVKTLRSNDLGVAFVLDMAGTLVYHAGDLNNWWWEGDEEDRLLEKRYHEELEKIRGMEFEAAFIPLDPRIRGYERGIEDFLRYAHAKYVFPMHFGHQTEIVERMLARPETAALPCQLMKIKKQGDCFTL